MPQMQFQPVLREIREILGSDFYTIPRFQRPYSWTSENLEDFWRDVVLDNDEGYFIGPMVAYTIKKGEFGIVDGQQRLTSIMLALASLRDLLLGMRETDYAEGMAKYLERADDDSQVHYVLQSLGAKEYLASQILARPPRITKQPSSEEERNLQKASSDIVAYFMSQIEGMKTDRDEDSPSEAAKHLRIIREKILSLKVIWIRLDEEDDAYIIFETLNSRGKDLEVVDLLKNLFFSHAKQENADLDTARSSWEEMRRILDEDGSRANPNKFILHWWLSQRAYTAERKLFRLIKRSISRAESPALILDLKANAELYARVVNPGGWIVRPGSAGKELRDSLLALTIFGVSQPRPMLLSLMRSWDAKDLKYATLRRAVRTIENFHFITTAVSEMYAKFARELHGATGDNARGVIVDQMINRLGSSPRLPADETFIAEFMHMRYSEQETGQKRLVQYTLRKLHDFERPGFALDHSKCNIEHLSSQAVGEEWMPHIGNLLWVDESLNNKLGSKSFAAKRTILKGFTKHYSLDDIVGADDWGGAEVEGRGRRLADLALHQVWSLT
jgi:Protein of unknown function DUF262/Protein of unknown function (DUF1524)